MTQPGPIAAAAAPDRDPRAVRSFPVTLIGGAARRALTGRSRWTVFAAFRRSFYCRDDGGSLVCFGPPSIGAGPLNAISTFDEAVNWQSRGVGPGASAWIDGAGLHLDGRFVLPFAEARRWRPPTPARTWTPSHLSRGLALLGREIARRVPSEGLAPVIPVVAGHRLGGPTGRAARSFLAAAWRGIASFDAWLVARFSGAKGAPGLPRRADVLIGLGPGLTPSGDDFVGGAMIALRALGRPAMADGVAGWALPLARTRTHPISFAHLECAAEGEGADALHRTLASLCRPGCPGLEAGLDDVAVIGHTSGWDALAGVAATCRAYLASRGEGPPFPRPLA